MSDREKTSGAALLEKLKELTPTERETLKNIAEGMRISKEINRAEARKEARGNAENAV